jgi:hypothetical protein
MRVALTTEEMIEYGAAGIARCANAMAKQRQGAHGFNRNFERWQIDVEALLSEYAAAKALGLPYTPVVGRLDTFEGDIGPGLQVRSTKYNSGSLLVHDRDPMDDYFILVTGLYGVYDIRGWIQAKHAKQPQLWKVYKGRGAFWVPQSMLQPMSKLPLPKAAA